MSLILLDTHAWVWLMNGSKRLGGKARKAIERSAEDGGVLVSAISPWEIAMLVAKGRLVLDRDVGEWVLTALAQPGIRLQVLSPELSCRGAAPRGMKTPAPLRPPLGGFQFARCARNFRGSP